MVWTRRRPAAVRTWSRDARVSALSTLLASSFLAVPALSGTNLAVVGTSPVRHTGAPRTTSIRIDFDQPVDASSVTTSSLRVFGLWSGPAHGSIDFSNADQTLTFTPDAVFSAGEVVTVVLSHDVAAAGGAPLRPAGYTFQFAIAAVPSAGTFTQIDVMSNRIDDQQTRIYGACAADMNHDGFCDLTTVNEVSADIRVFLSLADGTGLFGDFLTPEPIGVEASPNAPADFDNDGNTDLCISATLSESVWVLLGNGDGTFGTPQEIVVGGRPHGIAPLDVDGDGDMDIIVANSFSNDVWLMLNDGNGVFGAPASFDAGVGAEYGLAAGDLNADGIMDVVVGGFQGQDIRTLLGNGDGTFTPAGAAQPSGGLTWVVVLGDVNGDGDLDAGVANSTSGNVAVLQGNGDGTFGLPQLLTTGAHTPAIDFGDLDGDGDPDVVASSFGGGFWRIYDNDGTGGFSFLTEITAPSNPSCAVLFDADNDQDIDMALTDEIADVIVLMRNGEAVDVEPSEGTAPGRGVTWNAPNPVAHGTSIAFELPVAGAATLELFDVAGRRVLMRKLGERMPGLQRVALDLNATPLPEGVYVYRVSAGAWSAKDRLVVAR